MTKREQEYRKLMTRPHDIINDEFWDIGERLILPKKYKNLLFFDPLFIYQPKKGDTVYFNLTDPRQKFDKLIDYLENNIDWFLDTKREFNQNCREISKIIDENSQDYNRLVYLIKEVWPTITVAVVLGSTEIYKVSKRIRQLCVKVREESDNILHPAITYLAQFISKTIQKNYPELSRYTSNILVSECLSGKIPTKEELVRRRKGYLLHKGKIIYDIPGYLAKNNFKLREEEKNKIKGNIIKGQTACNGKASGKAKIIFELKELKKVKKGDILVTPMTTPDMMIAIKKAAAIITDEGGITCHAAIVSRELKIPCIIGTKWATQALSDGDWVEVDAEKGIVRKINNPSSN